MELNNIKELKEFLDWKKKEPEEYKEFLIQLKEFYKDMIQIIQ